MIVDPTIYQYPSRRNVIYSSRGMVATSQPLASQAGLEMLRRGGNAIDAIIAAATCLPVVEASNNGIGGDAFALIWADGIRYKSPPTTARWARGKSSGGWGTGSSAAGPSPGPTVPSPHGRFSNGAE